MAAWALLSFSFCFGVRTPFLVKNRRTIHFSSFFFLPSFLIPPCHTTDSTGHSHSRRRVPRTATVTVPCDYCVDLPPPRPLDFARGLIYLKLQTEFLFGDSQTNARFEQMRTALVEENRDRDREYEVKTVISLPKLSQSFIFVGDSARLPDI